MQQSPSLKADLFSASQEIPSHFTEHEGSLPPLQVPATFPYPDTTRTLINALILPKDQSDPETL